MANIDRDQLWPDWRLGTASRSANRSPSIDTHKTGNGEPYNAGILTEQQLRERGKAILRTALSAAGGLLFGVGGPAGLLALRQREETRAFGRTRIWTQAPLIAYSNRQLLPSISKTGVSSRLGNSYNQHCRQHKCGEYP